MVTVVVMQVGEAARKPPAMPTSDTMDAAAREGKLQYELITKESQMPRYGDCYQKTLKDLHEGCSDLTDEVQSRLALAFTNCYVARFGWDMYPCRKDQPLSECMVYLDSRTASVYSAMLSNTLTMCHFLQAQAWHQATTDAVHSLREASERVRSKLSKAVDSAAALKLQMDTQITESRQALKNAFSEIRESTAEQRGLIIDVFDRVAQLQSLLLGEFSWFYAVVFYVASVLVTLLVTCSPRTQDARIPSMGTLTCSLALERFMVNNTVTYLYSDVSQADMQVMVWIIRRLAATCCFLLLVKSALSYRDPIAAAAAKLEELTSATKEIKNLINSTPGMLVANESIKEQAEESDYSDDTYDPEEDSDSYSDLDDCPYPFTSHLMTTNEGGRKEAHYSLRPRPKEVQQNPLVALETADSFARTMRHLETLARHKSRAQVWHLSTIKRSNYGDVENSSSSVTQINTNGNSKCLALTKTGEGMEVINVF